MSIICAPIGLITTFITLFFELRNIFVKLFLGKTRHKKIKHEKNQMLLKKVLNSIKSITLKALQDSIILEKDSVLNKFHILK